VAKALTELQGGQIVLTSTLGHGTTASVRLPLRPD
jgi:signal transduction histidine kinase